MTSNPSAQFTTIGVPKETRKGERRVILLPTTVEALVKRGWRVLVEKGAGLGIGISDQAYYQAGAKLESAETVWGLADIVVKYKAPVQEEFRFFRKGLILTGILHAEGDPELTNALIKAGVTSYSYEFFQREDGHFPLAVAGSRIAGRMAAFYGIWLLQSQYGGAGKLPGFEADGAEAVHCVVIGSGNVGSSATEALLAMGCRVTLLTSGNDAKAKAVERFGVHAHNVVVEKNSNDTLSASLLAADLVIGAVLISTFDTPEMISEAMVRTMRPGSVLLDATAGYGGGYMPTFHQLSTLDSPSFVKHGVVHCKIDNYPAAVPATAVQMVNIVYTPFLVNLLDSLRDGTTDMVSQRGLVTHEGKIIHPEVLRHADHWSA